MTETEAVLSRLTVPLGVYDDIAPDTEAWAPLRAQFDGKLLVDLRRMDLRAGLMLEQAMLPHSAKVGLEIERGCRPVGGDAQYAPVLDAPCRAPALAWLL